MKDAPRSVCIYAGIPKREKSEVNRHLITVDVETSGQGNTKGNFEYSSITLRK